jgi:hypothetical protein
MTDNQLTQDEFETLKLFEQPEPRPEIDPMHFAKLLSLALISQQEGGPELTESGLSRLELGDHPRP